jgi:hypothetical protein
VFGPLFTAPSFRTFCGLACGFLSQAGKRSVRGMLAGAGLSRAWSHDRAHFFFACARWNAHDLGLAVARLVVALLVPAESRSPWRSTTPYSEDARRPHGHSGPVPEPEIPGQPQNRRAAGRPRPDHPGRLLVEESDRKRPNGIGRWIEAKMW